MEETLNFQKTNYIVETVKHIDRVQKEIVVTSATSCITCETSLITQANNTIPVTFYMCDSSPFIGFTTIDDTTGTRFFRIECIRDNRFVTLRMLTLVDGVLTCTPQTLILDLDCVCALQCSSPINCVEC